MAGWFGALCSELGQPIPSIFVETGTFQGHGIKRALEDFSRVYSIEIDAELVEKARQIYASDPRVTVIHGDSATELAELADELPRALFYLDAHWYGAGPKDSPQPVLAELTALRNRWCDDIIVIDDMRLMGKLTFDGDDIDYPKAWHDWTEASEAALIAAYRPNRIHHCGDIDRMVFY